MEERLESSGHAEQLDQKMADLSTNLDFRLNKIEERLADRGVRWQARFQAQGRKVKQLEGCIGALQARTQTPQACHKPVDLERLVASSIGRLQDEQVERAIKRYLHLHRFSKPAETRTINYVKRATEDLEAQWVQRSERTGRLLRSLKSQVSISQALLTGLLCILILAATLWRFQPLDRPDQGWV